MHAGLVTSLLDWNRCKIRHIFILYHFLFVNRTNVDSNERFLTLINVTAFSAFSRRVAISVVAMKWQPFPQFYSTRNNRNVFLTPRPDSDGHLVDRVSPSLHAIRAM
jgi:hypothetical protein